MNAANQPSSFRLSTSALSFVAGCLVTGALVLLAAAPRQGAAGQSGGTGRPPDSDQEIPGKPQGAGSGSDTEYKGPPRTGNQAPSGPMGYNNPGGMVDAQALQAAAAGGVHYHYHFYGSQGQGGGPAPGYAGTTYVNPASVAPTGDAAQYMPGYGPGNPGPLGSEAGLDDNPVVGSHTYTGFSAYGAAGNYFGGPGGYFGGGGGVAPGAMAANAAYASAGYVAGFND